MELVRLSEDSEHNPLAVLMADLIRQNVEQNPHKVAHLEGLRFVTTIEASDVDSAVTLVFSGRDGVEIHSLAQGQPHVTITADSESILDLARLSIHRMTGLPVLWNQVGRAFVLRLIRKHVRIQPFGRHLGKLTRVLSVISVSS